VACVLRGLETYTQMMVDFRMIALGDIDLQHEIRLNDIFGVVDRLCERSWVRRVYSAKIDGRKSGMTVAMYQGKKAKEVRLLSFIQIVSYLVSKEWRRDVSRYSSLRYIPYNVLPASG
jgi:hypothetical protein